MLQASLFQRFDFDNAFQLYNQRLPYLYQTIGPKVLGERVQGVHLWDATVQGGVVSITGPDGQSLQRNVPEGSQFVFAFDLNGVMYWGHELTGEVTWNYFDNRTQQFEVIKFQGALPLATLDSTGPRREPLVDVVLAYQKDNAICIRYQRERFATEHYVGDIPEGVRLRCMGMNSEYRWVFRFDGTLPEGYTWEVLDGG